MNSEQSSVVQPRERIFWPRTSEVIGELAEKLGQDPERALTDEEISEALAFENDLFEGRYGDMRASKSLEDLSSIADIDSRIYPAFFTTAKGRERLQNFLGREDIGDTEAEITETVAGIPFSVIKDKEDEFKSIAGASSTYATEYYTDAVLNDKPVPEIGSISLTREPETFLQHASGIVVMKQFLRGVQADLKQRASENPSNLIDAKLAITDLYRDKMNAVLADVYPKLQDFLRQFDAQPKEEQRKYKAMLNEVPVMVGLARTAMGTPSIQSQFVRLLDYVRNGAAYDSDGKLTPIDSQIYDDIDYIRTENERPVDGEPVFDTNEIAVLQEIELDAEGAKDLAEKYKDRLGIDVDIVIREDKQSLAYSAPKDSVWIPGKYKAKLVKKDGGTGVALVIVHEIGGTKPGHATQTENSRRNDKALRIATSPIFRGKRYQSLRESGSIVTENTTGERLFGSRRPMSGSYARALEVLLAGEPTSKAVAAFAIEQLQGNNDQAAKKNAIKLGANRVQRMLRHGGRDSQPLQYVEAATVRRIIEGLDAETQDIILAEGTLDPVDMLRLHRFGLLNTKAALFEPREDPDEVMVELLREQISKHRSGNGSPN